MAGISFSEQWWVFCCNKQNISGMWDEIFALQLQSLIKSEQRPYQHTSKLLNVIIFICASFQITYHFPLLSI